MVTVCTDCPRVVGQCDVEDLVSSLDLPPLTTSLEGIKDYIRKGKLSNE